MYHCNWSHCKEQASVAWTENEYIFDKQLGSFFFYFAQFIYLKKTIYQTRKDGEMLVFKQAQTGWGG